MKREIVDIELVQLDDRDLEAGRPDVGACGPALFIGLLLAGMVLVWVVLR